jgi:hypothetical protein
MMTDYEKARKLVVAKKPKLTRAKAYDRQTRKTIGEVKQ